MNNTEPKFKVGALLIPINKDNLPDDIVATTFLIVGTEKEKDSLVKDQVFIYLILEDDKVEKWSDTMVNEGFKELEEDIDDHEKL